MSSTPNLPITPNLTISTPLTAANTARDGTGTTSLIATAGTSGAYLYQIRVMPIGTNTQSLLRIFLNNGATPATATNNLLLYEIQLLGTTASETNAVKPVVYACDLPIPANYRLYACLATAVAAGWQPLAIMDDY